MKTKVPTHNLYHELVPPLIHALTNLDGLVRMAERHAKKSKFDVGNLLNARLAPDMLSFIGQVQYAYFTALESAGTLSEKKVPNLPYNERDAKQLEHSLKRVISYLRSLTPRHFEEAEKKKVETFLLVGKHLRATDYVRLVALPNAAFHVTTAYDILRHNGVPLTKDNYLGRLPSRAKKKK